MVLLRWLLVWLLLVWLLLLLLLLLIDVVHVVVRSHGPFRHR